MATEELAQLLEDGLWAVRQDCEICMIDFLLILPMM